MPPGFVVSADAYQRFLTAGGLDDAIAARIEAGAADAIPGLIRQTGLPADLEAGVRTAYDGLCAMHGLACAVRSSSVAEDGAKAAFAGLYESFLNVQGFPAVLTAIKGCYASLWSERARRYRSRQGIGTEAMAVVVMGLAPVETAGIAFTAHPVTGALDQVVINSSWGLGEAVVGGLVTPDSFVVAKQSYTLIERQIADKELAIIPNTDSAGTVEKTLTAERAAAPSLTDDQACAVARLAVAVEEHYGAPQDIEFGSAGGDIYLLQSRPITTLG